MKINKQQMQFIFAVVIALCGVGLFVGGMCTPPYGAIDHSVLVAGGELLVFAGSVIGIDYHYRTKNNANGDDK